MSTPPTRWAQAGPPPEEYADTFAAVTAAGDDVEGEARLADVLLPRGGRVLDAGSGTGRVGGALVARGHRVTGVEVDPVLVRRSRAEHPELEVVEADLLAWEPAPGEVFDLVVCVGNVLVYLAEGTETDVLRRLGAVLAPGGRVLAGFHLVAERPGARDYPADAFTADVAAAGLAVQARFGTWQLGPPADDYGVWVLTRA